LIDRPDSDRQRLDQGAIGVADGGQQPAPTLSQLTARAFESLLRWSIAVTGVFICFSFPPVPSVRLDGDAELIGTAARAKARWHQWTDRPPSTKIDCPVT
jgi:hypothetical protein